MPHQKINREKQVQANQPVLVLKAIASFNHLESTSLINEELLLEVIADSIASLV